MTLARTIAAAAALLLSQAQAQAGPGDGDASKARFTSRIEQTPDGARELVLDASVAPGWQLYASDFEQPEIGPRAARITLAEGLKAEGGLRSVDSRQGQGKTFAGAYRYTYFTGHGQLRQRLSGPAGEVKGTIQAQVCFQESGLCELVRQEVAAR